MTEQTDPQEVLDMMHGKTPTELFALMTGYTVEEINELGGLPDVHP